MWETSDYIAAVALAVSILVGIYAWWDRRTSRTDSYRAALYQRQLAAVDEFVGHMFTAHQEAMAPASSETNAKIEAAQDRALEAAFRSAYIPPEVVSAGAKLLREITEAEEKHVEWLELVASAIEKNERPPEQTHALHVELDEAWRRFVHRVQIETGTKRLHGEVRELIGAAAAKRRREDRIARRHRIDLELEVRSRGRTKAPPIADVVKEVEAEEMGRGP